MAAIALRPVDMFQRFHDLGYTRLIPIIPPDAPISPRSSLALRLKAGKDDRGKTPGVRRTDRDWSGVDWINLEATPDARARWNEWGAGVGVKTPSWSRS